MTDVFKIKQAKDSAGKPIQSWYWVRVAPNHEVIATSETYTRKSDAVESAKRESEAAEVEDG